MSVTMLIAALAGPRLATIVAPRRVAQIGLVALVIATFGLIGTIDAELNGAKFALALAVFGAGVGLLLSQLGNVIMSSVPESKTNEAGGLQGTAQNLGASLGTALVGSVLLASLTSGFVTRIESNPALPQDVQKQITDAAASGIDVVPVDQVEQIARDAGLPPDEAAAVADDYGNAELDGLKKSFLAIAFLGIGALWFTRRLPGVPLPVADAVPAAEPVPERPGVPA
jgi:MFS family permease